MDELKNRGYYDNPIKAVISLAHRQIHKFAKEQVGTLLFGWVSFVYLWITPGFCCHSDRRCADALFRAMKKQISLVSIVLIYLLYLTKAHCMAMLFFAAPSLEPLHDGQSRVLSKDFIQLCKTAKKKN